MTLRELEGSRFGAGGTSEGYDVAWRLKLLKNLSVVVKQLWSVGVSDVFVDGSFVEDRPHPNDIDGYFTCKLFDLMTGDLEMRLNGIDPYKCWTWDHRARRRHPDSTKAELPMWHIYRVDMFPHWQGQPPDGCDQHIPTLFRRQKATDKPKGIVKLLKEARL
ncbi:MAG TPA: hypothetical protein VN934_03685 [Candidatus Tumulicola sp.]|nr:hypothetical protein [Candidatus Tumulicola sp.]